MQKPNKKSFDGNTGPEKEVFNSPPLSLALVKAPCI